MFNKKNKNFSLSYFKNDFPAAIVVWLVALPLCIGIAQGSGVNAFSGIIAGIIGGIVVTFFSGSKFGVSGPAAGLITIVVAGIGTLDGDNPAAIFFLAVFLSGVIQFLLGLFRLGVIGYFVPTSVINGMLASIGLILMLKQIPSIIGGFKGSAISTDAYDKFLSANEIASKTDLHLVTKLWIDTKSALMDPSYGALIIFIACVAIMLLWELKFFKTKKIFQYLPGSLVAVIMGGVLAYLFSSLGADSGSSLAILTEQKVGLPLEVKNWDFKNLIQLPDFSHLANPQVWLVALTIAIVGSIETLLSVEATDKLDPDKNISPTNKELKAQGIGNIISGLIGGLPITMVIVRSSANINAKAKTQLSAIYHGILLLVSVFAFPGLLEMIPTASLAAILCILGFKLLKLKKVIEMFKTDIQGAIVILVTISAVLATDLLKGVGIGFALAMFFILRKNYELALISHTDEKENETVISFAQIVSFLNKGALMQTLQKIPNGSKVKMSAVKCHTMSKEIQEVIVDFRDISSKKNNIDLELIGFEKFDFINADKDSA
ncbi:MAG: SulP family inorganic anion transporter [Parvicellaceae bacterium]